MLEIEDFHTQDDFNDDFTNVQQPTETKKDENIPSTSNTISDVVEEFLNDDFDIFPKQESKVKQAKPLKSSWTEQAADNHNAASVQIDTKTLPLQTNKDGDQVLKFYWIDAWEDKFVKPGVVYMFGKVYVNPSNKKAGCVSCCLVVKNVNRKLYLLPREYVSIFFSMSYSCLYVCDDYEIFFYSFTEIFF